VEVALLQGRPIATTVTLVRNRTAIYLYGGSLGDEAALRARPYNVLLFRALRFAREKGAAVLDLGTSLPTQTGLVRFKEGLGGTTDSLAYLAWPRAVERPEQDGFMARVAGAVLARLPLPLFERLTPLILKQVG
jgi:CelD/BcsL family acetyltransferase involved in cellulose biosynthesis